MIHFPRMVVIFGELVTRRLLGSIRCLIPRFPTIRKVSPKLHMDPRREVRDALPMEHPAVAPTPVEFREKLWVDLIPSVKISPGQDFKSHLLLNGPQ
jgi:hypothetical protein